MTSCTSYMRRVLVIVKTLCQQVGGLTCQLRGARLTCTRGRDHAFFLEAYSHVAWTSAAFRHPRNCHHFLAAGFWFREMRNCHCMDLRRLGSRNTKLSSLLDFPLISSGFRLSAASLNRPALCRMQVTPDEFLIRLVLAIFGAAMLLECS